MEELLVKVLKIIDLNLRRKLTNLESKITQNRRNFESLKSQKERIQKELMRILELNKSEPSLSEQIGNLFELAEENIRDRSLSGVDISRVIEKTNFLGTVGFDFVLYGENALFWVVLIWFCYHLYFLI